MIGLLDVPYQLGLKGLGSEVLLKIMSYLTVRELCLMSQVNKYFDGLCQADYLWEGTYEANKNLKKGMYLPFHRSIQTQRWLKFT